MPFSKDILIIDFEATGNDTENDVPVQLAAILLDKDTLEEKSFFNSFINADYEKIMPIVRSKITATPQDLEKAPDIASVATAFIEKFGFDYFLSSWVTWLDMAMLQKTMDSIGVGTSRFDYHIIDLWPLAYVWLIKHGYKGKTNSQDMFEALGIERKIHDALGDCRMEADILRKILAN